MTTKTGDITTAYTRGWPPKRRREQAERIRRQKPWRQATGPRSKEGKKASCMNAMKHGLHSAVYQNWQKKIRQTLRRQQAFLKDINRMACGKTRLRLSFLFGIINNTRESFCKTNVTSPPRPDRVYRRGSGKNSSIAAGTRIPFVPPCFAGANGMTMILKGLS